MSIAKLKKAIKEEKLVYGYKETLGNLRQGKTKVVFLSSNCPEDIKNKIKDYKAEIISLKIPNEEISILCKKPFLVSVLSY